jgi:3-oxoacyl-[acyl-carrier protein] reductase
MGNYLIIGGTKGIGKAVADILNESGESVHVWARSGEKDSHFTQNDVTTAALDLSNLPESLNGVVYCPGSINLKPFHRLTEEDFYNDWQVNFMGAVRAVQAVLPLLKKVDNASIVLYSTVAVGTGMPFHASVAAAKAAVEGLTKSLAAELAPKIRVNCIAPSLTNTPLAEKLLSSPEKIEMAGKRHPLQRVGTPNDIAEATVFLLSEKSSWLTGQILHIDGGMSTLKL